MQNDMLTTASKVLIENTQYNRLFKRLLIAYGKPNGDCTIEVHGMSTTEASKFDEKIIARYQVGFISKAKAISLLERIPLEEAEEEAKKIEKEEKVKAEQEAKNKAENGGMNNNAKV